MTAQITYHFRAGYIPTADLARFGEALGNGDSRVVVSEVRSVPGQLWDRLAELDALEHGKPTGDSPEQGALLRGLELGLETPATLRHYFDRQVDLRRPAMRARRG